MTGEDDIARFDSRRYNKYVCGFVILLKCQTLTLGGNCGHMDVKPHPIQPMLSPDCPMFMMPNPPPFALLSLSPPSGAHRHMCHMNKQEMTSHIRHPLGLIHIYISTRGHSGVQLSCSPLYISILELNNSMVFAKVEFYRLHP